MNIGSYKVVKVPGHEKLAKKNLYLPTWNCLQERERERERDYPIDK